MCVIILVTLNAKSKITQLKIREGKEKKKRLLAQKTLSARQFIIDQHSIVVITNTQGKIVDVNNKFCNISGYSRDELIGQNQRLLNAGDLGAKYWETMFAQISSGNVWRDKIRNKAKNGDYYWIDTTIAPMFDSEGNIENYFSIQTDITELKLAQFKLEGNKMSLEEKASQLEKANEQLKILSEIDPLTQIPNRRVYEQVLTNEIA